MTTESYTGVSEKGGEFQGLTKLSEWPESCGCSGVRMKHAGLWNVTNKPEAGPLGG